MSKSKKDSTLVYDDNVIINDFMFCGHGHEYCSHCCTDHRYTNNIQLDDDLINDSDALEEAADRPPLSIEGRFFNTGKRIPKSDPRTPGDPIFACEEHRKPDCKTCFDWPKMIRKATGKKDKGRVDDRHVLLGVLSAMGVVLPASTKLSTDALEKKLTSALNFAQEISKFAAKMPIDPADLPEWKGKKVYESIRRSNIQEAMQNFRSMSLGQDSAFPLYENSFIDARQTIMSLGKHFDDGLTSFVCQDKDQQEACCMRILGVYRLDENTPLILLSYASQTAHEPITKTLDFIQAQMKVGHIAQITCTREEQALLRRLLYLNSTKIVPGFKTNLEAYEKNFRLSFIIPVGPLAQVDIGRLTSDPGCTVCGKKTASRCSSCLSVNYCGSECQRAHWKEHKSFCRSVRGGTWRTVTFSDSLVFDGQRLSSNIISHSSLKLQSTRKGAEDGQGPPNIHGDRTFMVKLQRPLGGNGTVVGILVYDRTRSFSGHINRNEQGEPAVHDEMMRYMPMDGALKIYRWAKRVGDYQLSICIDREPSEIPQW